MRRRRWRVIAIVAVVAYLLLKMWCGSSEEAETLKDELLVNRVWIDHLPEDFKENATAFVMTDQEIGVVAIGSVYRRTMDAVKWAQKGGDLEWVYLQDDKTVKYGLKVWRCEKDAPEPFELCLTLDHGGKKLRYFSRMDWEIGALPSDAPELIKNLQ